MKGTVRRNLIVSRTQPESKSSEWSFNECADGNEVDTGGAAQLVHTGMTERGVSSSSASAPECEPIFSVSLSEATVVTMKKGFEVK